MRRPSPPRFQFTIFDALELGIMLLCGIGAMALTRSSSLPLQALAFLLGFAIVPLLLRGATAMIAKGERLPPCRNGRCRAAQYQCLESSSDGSLYRCACGDRYLQTPSDEFKFMRADGATEPYLQRFYPQGPWRPPLDLSRYSTMKEPD